MKKTLLIIMSVLFIGNSFANAAVAVNCSIGKRSVGCGGSGCCGVELNARGPHTVALSEDGKTLILTLNINALKKAQPDKIQYFDGKKNVTWEENYTLPSDVSKALHAPSQLQINTGIFPVSTDNISYLIRIPISYYNTVVKPNTQSSQTR